MLCVQSGSMPAAVQFACAGSSVHSCPVLLILGAAMNGHICQRVSQLKRPVCKSVAHHLHATACARDVAAEPCPLWGCHGEGWSRTGLLGDWSFAGYGAGLEAIPSPPVTVDVKRDFHAAGNGVSDDTAAVKAAIDATRAAGGVIYFPPGK